MRMPKGSVWSTDLVLPPGITSAAVRARRALFGWRLRKRRVASSRASSRESVTRLNLWAGRQAALFQQPLRGLLLDSVVMARASGTRAGPADRPGAHRARWTRVGSLGCG